MGQAIIDNAAAMNEAQASIRLPQEALDRVDALVQHLRSRPDLAPWRITRGGVLRLAVLRGLESLEKEYFGKRSASK